MGVSIQPGTSLCSRLPKACIKCAFPHSSTLAGCHFFQNPSPSSLEGIWPAGMRPRDSKPFLLLSPLSQAKCFIWVPELVALTVLPQRDSAFLSSEHSMFRSPSIPFLNNQDQMATTAVALPSPTPPLGQQDHSLLVGRAELQVQIWRLVLRCRNLGQGPGQLVPHLSSLDLLGGPPHGRVGMVCTAF